MYKIPLTNSPNQKFNVTIPVGDENINFIIELNYNTIAEYWSMTLTTQESNLVIFSQLPLLFSHGEYASMTTQFQYKNIGNIYIVPIEETESSMPNSDDIGKKYIMVWGDGNGSLQ